MKNFQSIITLLLFPCLLSCSGNNSSNQPTEYISYYDIMMSKMDSVQNLIDKDTLKMSMKANEFDEDTFYYEESYRQHAFSLSGLIRKSGNDVRFYVLAHATWSKGNPLQGVKFNADGEKFTFRCHYFYKNNIEYIGSCQEYLDYNESDVNLLLNSKKVSALFVYDRGDAPIKEFTEKEYASLNYMYNQYIIMRGFL